MHMHTKVSTKERTQYNTVSYTSFNLRVDSAHVRRAGRVTRRADTNVLAVKFNTLVEPSDVHTGDSVVCVNTNCTAILSHLSTVKDHKDTDKEEKVGMVI